MKKVLRKTITFLLLTFAAFFAFSNEFKAATLTGVYPKKYDTYWVYFHGLQGRSHIDMGIFGIYSIDGNHAYCVEPGISLGGSYKASTHQNISEYAGSDNVYFNSSNAQSKREMISQILTFAHKLNSVPSSNFNYTEVDKVFAAQGLIWEVVTGERTSFSGSETKPKNADNARCFYNRIHSGYTYTMSQAANIGSEYDRIINAIRGSFLRNPGSGNNVFKLSSKADSVPLVWDGSKYTLTINDTNFQYWEFESKGSDLTVNTSSDKITISTTKSINKSSAQ